MKHRLFIVYGKNHCRIVKNREIDNFNEIKEEIVIYEFSTIEELTAFKKGVDEGIGHKEYYILREEELVYVMEKSDEKGN